MLASGDYIETVRRLAMAIKANTSLARSDCLWPSNPAVFATNPMSLAYGATGIALFLKRAEGTLPPGVESWILNQPLNEEIYPPGLLIGLSGIAYSLHQIGLKERALEAMEACFRSPLLDAEASMFHGIAGWGSVSLYFFRQTGQPRFATMALEAARLIADLAIIDEAGGAFWPSSLTDSTYYGFGYGSSGVGLFLLNAGLALGDGGAVRLGRAALEFDIAHRLEDAHGWTWYEHSTSTRMLAFWAGGAAGVGAAAIRFWRATGDHKYLEWALTIGRSVAISWAVLPSLLEGMAGIGEYFIDLYLATGDTHHLGRAFELAEAVSWYVIDSPSGAVVPGRYLNRASFDFASGSAGIGLFLERLTNPSPHLLADLN